MFVVEVKVLGMCEESRQRDMLSVSVGLHVPAGYLPQNPRLYLPQLSRHVRESHLESDSIVVNSTATSTSTA